jgi:homoserine kinase type II
LDAYGHRSGHHRRDTQTVPEVRLHRTPLAAVGRDRHPAPARVLMACQGTGLFLEKSAMASLSSSHTAKPAWRVAFLANSNSAALGSGVAHRRPANAREPSWCCAAADDAQADEPQVLAETLAVASGQKEAFAVSAGPGAVAGLLTRWGIPANADLARAERGSNNQTFVVAHDSRRWVLRVSQNLTATQARAEHRLLGRLHCAGLPFQVPEPVTTVAGGTVAESAAGPATLCRWIPGVRPDLTREPALEQFGRAIGLLSEAMRTVPPDEAPQDWRGGPLRAHPEAPDVEDLCRALRGAGARSGQVRLLETAARRVATWALEAGGGLPVQVVHGDVGASNTLVDERTGQVTGMLDFELAGPGFRVQDLMVGLLSSVALDLPGWQRRVAALVRGHVSVLRLDQAEIRAVPDLMVSRCVGSVLWRAGRWRRGHARLDDVAARLAVLDAIVGWLAVSGEQLLSLLFPAG